MEYKEDYRCESVFQGNSSLCAPDSFTNRKKRLRNLFAIVWDDARSPKNTASHLLDSGEMIKNLF